MLVFAALTAMLIAAPTIAQETTTYTYDALGRLITTSISGGPNNGTQTGTTFDPASNRTNYTVTGALVPPSFAIGNAPAVSEGGNLTFTVTKTGTTSSSYSVNYTTGGGTATSGTDYAATSGTLTFPAGSTTSLPIAVPTLTDSVVESPETVLVTLSSPTGGATITTSQGSGTINDNTSSNLPPVANDTDPENNVPLHLVSITGPGSATVTSTTSVTIGENSTGTFTFSYVVADSLGATSTGQLTATVTGLASQCVSF